MKGLGYETYYVGDHFEVDSGTEVKYIFAGNQRVAKVTAGGTHFFHKDHLGSSNVVTDYANGAVVETSEYMPFGQTREHSGTVISSYKFTDQEYDPATGLYNYDARLYDPVVGRFVTADSIIPDWYDPQLLNRYAYALNNPLAYIDPDGHAPADLARSWEESAAQSSAALDQMVSAHSWTWPIAAAAQTAMDVAAGTVDMLKLGEGVAEGGAENIAADIGRASGIVLVVAGASAKSVPKGAPKKGVFPKSPGQMTKELNVDPKGIKSGQRWRPSDKVKIEHHEPGIHPGEPNKPGHYHVSTKQKPPGGKTRWVRSRKPDGSADYHPGDTYPGN